MKTNVSNQNSTDFFSIHYVQIWAMWMW